MPVIPKIPQQQVTTKKCARCNRILPSTQFSSTRSYFYSDGLAPICNSCIAEYIEEGNDNWERVNKVCQWLDIPFIVREWERVREITLPTETWGTYSKIFMSQDYEDLGWDSYFKQYKKLKEVGLIEEEIPELREKRYAQLRRKWGENYEDDELNHLEDLYKGLMNTQNINGALQIDQAQKLCKLSLEIDNRIRAGDKEVDKFMSSYDKIIKSAEFTPKNVKNATDFDSFAEVAYWLEKHGKINQFYDDTTRDIIDETIKNIQSYNQRLYVNEGGIGEEITNRLQSLKLANSHEQNIYDIQPTFDLDEYENSGYVIDEDEDFDPGGESNGADTIT